MYQAWQAMLARCYNPNASGYQDYTGRGITVCDRWRDSFENYDADILAILGPQPSPKYEVDRTDNYGHYEPSNVRWATKKVQQRNTRKNRLLTYNGQTKCVSEWAELLGMWVSTIFTRLRLGWSDEKALSTSVKG
jgi:hypothetical protein